MAETRPQDIGVQISKSITEKLDRMRFINSVIDLEGGVLGYDELMTEYRTMLADIVRTFMPLVTQLAKSASVTVNIDIDEIDDIQKYSTLFGELKIIFNNGNICIDTEYSGGTLRKTASH